MLQKIKAFVNNKIVEKSNKILLWEWDSLPGIERKSRREGAEKQVRPGLFQGPANRASKICSVLSARRPLYRRIGRTLPCLRKLIPQILIEILKKDQKFSLLLQAQILVYPNLHFRILGFYLISHIMDVFHQ